MICLCVLGVLFRLSCQTCLHNQRENIKKGCCFFVLILFFIHLVNQMYIIAFMIFFLVFDKNIWKAKGVPQQNNAVHPKHQEETSPNRSHKITSCR